MPVEIPLTRGKVAIVDDADAESVLRHRWHAQINANGAAYAAGYPTPYNRVLMHRFILSAPPGMDIDHINGDGLDNRRSNLRLATRSQNIANNHRAFPRTGYRGVYYRSHGGSKPFVALINRIVDGRQRQICLGYHATAKEAAVARDVKMLEIYGEFAVLNFPELRSAATGEIAGPAGPF